MQLLELTVSLLRMPLIQSISTVIEVRLTIDWCMFNRLDIGTKGLIFLMKLMPDDTSFETLAILCQGFIRGSFQEPYNAVIDQAKELYASRG